MFNEFTPLSDTIAPERALISKGIGLSYLKILTQKLIIIMHKNKINLHLMEVLKWLYPGITKTAYFHDLRKQSAAPRTWRNFPNSIRQRIKMRRNIRLGLSFRNIKRNWRNPEVLEYIKPEFHDFYRSFKVIPFRNTHLIINH